jgi:AraC family transcriptional regulator, transcriptional activator of pobA
MGPMSSSLSEKMGNSCYSNLFEIRSIEWLEQYRKEFIGRVHTCMKVMIVWITKGKLVHQVDLARRYEMSNALYGIKPGHSHCLLVGKDTEGCVIYFDPELLLSIGNGDFLYKTQVFRSSPVNLLTNISEEMKSDIEEACSRLLKEFNNHAVDRVEIVRSHLRILLTHLECQAKINCDQSPFLARNDRVGRFFSLLEDNYIKKRRVSDYASDLAVTPSYLNELIKSATGNTVRFHIRQRVMLEAKRYVTCKDISLKETAVLLGFDDMAHFSKYFKQGAGINFTDFRKESLRKSDMAF